MSKLTWKHVARALAWFVGLWCVMIFGVVLAGFVCGFVAYSKPQHSVTVVKYTTAPAPRPGSSGE